MEKLTPDILIEAFGLQLDEASQTGNKEELEAVMKYAQRVILRQLAPELLKKEQEAMQRMEERELSQKTQSGEPKSLVNLSNGPVGQAMAMVDKVETKE